MNLLPKPALKSLSKAQSCLLGRFKAVSAVLRLGVTRTGAHQCRAKAPASNLEVDHHKPECSHGFAANSQSPRSYVHRLYMLESVHADLTLVIVPVAIATAVVQASIYDVPGGYRAVMFDRFAGVKDEVRLLCSL